MKIVLFHKSVYEESVNVADNNEKGRQKLQKFTSSEGEVMWETVRCHMLFEADVWGSADDKDIPCDYLRKV